MTLTYFVGWGLRGCAIRRILLSYHNDRLFTQGVCISAVAVRKRIIEPIMDAYVFMPNIMHVCGVYYSNSFSQSYYENTLILLTSDVGGDVVRTDLD